MKRLLIGTGWVASLALAVPAFAQVAPRVHVQGSAGPSFGTESSSVFAGGAGMRVGRWFQITGEVGRMRNVLPKPVKAVADALANELRAETGSAVSVNARASAMYATGGVRWLVPSRGAVHPYLGVTAGLARVTPHVNVAVEGVSLGSGGSDESMTEPLVGVGGGVTLDANSRLAFELGYHYNRIFTPDPAIETSRVMGALLVRF